MMTSTEAAAAEPLFAGHRLCAELLAQLSLQQCPAGLPTVFRIFILVQLHLCTLFLASPFWPHLSEPHLSDV